MKNSGEVFLPLRGGGEGGVTTVHIAKPNAYNWKLQLKGLEGLAGQIGHVLSARWLAPANPCPAGSRARLQSCSRIFWPPPHNGRKG